MIDISAKLRSAFLRDSTPKNILIEFEPTDYAKVNFRKFKTAYTHTYSNYSIGNAFGNSNENLSSSDLINSLLGTTAYIACKLTGKFSSWSSAETPAYINVLAYVVKNGVGEWITPAEPVAFSTSTFTFTFTIPTKGIDRITRWCVLEVLDADGNVLGGTCNCSLSLTPNYIGLNGVAEVPTNAQINSMVNVVADSLDINDYVRFYPWTYPLTNENLDGESLTLQEQICSAETLKFGAVEASRLSFDTYGLDETMTGAYFNASITCDEFSERVPLGRFMITAITDEGDTTNPGTTMIKRHVEAYDGVKALDFDASKWFSDITVFPEFVITKNNTLFIDEHRPQMMSVVLSNFLNYIKSPLQPKNSYIYDETAMSLDTTFGGLVNLKSNLYMQYACCKLDNYPLNFDLYSIAYRPGQQYDSIPDVEAIIDSFCASQNMSEYADYYGVKPSNGGLILIVTKHGDPSTIRCISQVSAFPSTSQGTAKEPCGGDLVKVNIPREEPTNSDIYVLFPTSISVGGTSQTICQASDFIPQLRLAQYAFGMDLTNFDAPLIYYNWKDNNVASQKVTGREVLRSLFEINGKFFKYSREGKMQIISVSGGLYPSEELYPSTDLYPEPSEMLEGGNWRSFKRKNFRVSDYGKIEVVGDGSNYVYDSGSSENTYVMDDNVFFKGGNYKLSDDGVDMNPSLSTTLANMLGVIQGISYTPLEAEVVGMPWVECGDKISINATVNGADAPVLQRTLTGINCLVDSVEAQGEKQTLETTIYDWRV